MRQKRSSFDCGPNIKRKRIIKKILAGLIILILFPLLPVFYNKLKRQNGNERRDLREFYDSGAYETVYSQSGAMLKEKPLDTFLLTIHGFSAYELAIAQINNFNTLSYTDECIWSLRKTLLFKKNPQDAMIFYVLGKAYYYKGQGYADLAVKYLEKARASMDRLGDIPEYLGLAYAAVRDFRSSVSAFALALTEEGPSDILLISIARSYMALEEYDSGRAYIIRCLETSKDFKTIAAARLLLGEIYFRSGNIQGAKEEYSKIINENGENAEAHFRLGELYALEGDIARARAEWRRATRIDPAHGPARSRLNI